MWSSYRAFKKHAKVNLTNIMHTWRQFTAFQKASRKFKQEARLKRKMLVQDFLQSASQCELDRDIAQWYKRIGQLCPKAKHESIHLKDQHGEPMSPEASIACMDDFF